MPRDGSGVYTKPYPSVVSGTTIESLVYNGQVDDVTADLNTARPIVSGGTGANNAAGGLFNLGGEKATQVVTSYDSHVWVPGSFRSAVGATGAPNATAVFSGACYIHEAIANPPTNQNVTVEARDVSDGVLYIRTKTAGTWSAWKTERASIYAAPFDALAYNGMQINGSMEVSQELGLSNRSSVGYTCDGWFGYWAGSMVITHGTAFAGPQGVPVVLYASASTAAPSLGSGDYAIVFQKIEGVRVRRLAWGAAAAQPITIGFWTCHVRPGLYSVAVSNAAGNRSYVATYTHATTGVWQFNTVTIPGDTTGTWLNDNTIGIQLSFCLGSGSGVTAPSANTWHGALYLGAPGQINGVAATTDSFRLTGVVVLPGIEAPSAARSPLIMRPYDQELVTCKRYFRPLEFNGPMASANAISVSMNTNYAMRAPPTITATQLLGVYGNGADRIQSGLGASFSSTPTSTIGLVLFPNFTGLVAGGAVIRTGDLSFNVANLDARL